MLLLGICSVFVAMGGGGIRLASLYSAASRRSAVMAKKAGLMQKSLQLSSSAWSAGMQSPEVAQLGGEAAASRDRKSVV